MGLLGKLFGALVALLMLALAALWLVPPRLDMDAHRDYVAWLASQRLGRDVRIAGAITLRLLPEPILTATDVSVGAGEGIGATAQELRLRLALAPLLEGRINARELVLRGAELRLPWPLDPAKLMVRTPTWLSALSARVEEGRLAIGDLAFSHIDATLTTGADTGASAADGTAEISGHAWRFAARLTQPGTDGSAGLDVALDGQGPLEGTGAKLTGQIAPDGSLAGRVAAHGPDLSHLLPAPAVSFRAEGRITIAGGLAAADDLALEIGGAPARGVIAVRVAPVPRLDLALATSRLDLDAWLSVLTRRSALSLPISIDLSAEAATFAGGTLRGLRGAVDMSRDGTAVREARAMLPGDAPLRLSGRITALGDGIGPSRPRFEGDVSVTAPALRTTLGWLEHAGVVALAALPDGVLRSADLSGHVVAEATQVAVGALDGMVDGTHVNGSLTVRGAGRVAVGAGLSVERLDLDAWLPAATPSLASLPNRFANYDVNLRLEAKTALFHGVTLAPLLLDAAAEGGRLTVRKLDMQFNGAHADGSATLTEGGVLSEGRLDIQAPRAEPLAALLPESLAELGHRAPRLWRAAANVQVLGAGAPNKLGLKVTADLADLRLEAQPTLDLTAHTWTATMMVRHPGAPRLAEALGIADAAAWLGDGSLSLIAQLAGTADHVSADSFELTAASLRATGALDLRRGGPPSLSGHIDAETLPLPLPYPRALDPLPLAVLANWDATVKLRAGRVLAGLLPVMEQAQGTLALSNGVLRVDGLTASVGGGALTGGGTLDATAEPPRLAAKLSLARAALSGPLFDMPLDLASGTVDLDLGIAASGHSPAALLSTLSGDMTLSVTDGVLAGLAIAKIAPGLAPDSVRAALAGGATPFQTLTLAGHFDRGVLALARADMVAPSGKVAVSGTVDVAGAAADLTLAIVPSVPDAPAIGLRLSGPLDAPRRTPELADLTRWRTVHAAPDEPDPGTQ